MLCNRYSTGVENLKKAEEEVTVLEQMIIKETPLLEETSKQVSAEKVKIQAAAEEAEASGAIVFEKKTIADANKLEVEGEKNQIEGELAKAKPFLDEAESKIKKVDEKDISELFS